MGIRDEKLSSQISQRRKKTVLVLSKSCLPTLTIYWIITCKILNRVNPNSLSQWTNLYHSCLYHTQVSFSRCFIIFLGMFRKIPVGTKLFSGSVLNFRPSSKWTKFATIITKPWVVRTPLMVTWFPYWTHWFIINLIRYVGMS